MYYLQHNTGAGWTTLISNEDRNGLMKTMERYKAIFQHSVAKTTNWRVIDDNDLAAERIPFLKRMASGPTERHTCHWPGCDKVVPPRMWGCATHWFRLPLALRNEIWRTYRPGQEITKTPSAEYLAAAHAVQDWIRGNV